MAKDVLVVITETGPEGGLTAGGREALGLGARIAEGLSGRLLAAVRETGGSPAVREAGGRGAEVVYSCPAPAQGAALVAMAAAAQDRAQAGVIIISRGAHVLDLAPRLAARLGGGCVMGVTDVRFEDSDVQAVAAVFGGAARAVYRFTASGPRVIGGAPGSGEAPTLDPGRTFEVVDLSVPPTDTRVRVVEPARPAEGARLEDAAVVVSGGRGLRQAANYQLIRDLAAVLGGMPGASRAIVDESWATPAQQVGLTGKVVTPRLYIAAGISGASQHMAGCSNSQVLVAINTDPQAPIFRYAHFGVVDDCLAVLPELIRLARERA